MAETPGKGLLWMVVAAIGVCCATELFFLGGSGLAVGGAVSGSGWLVAAGVVVVLATLVFLRRRR